MFIASTKDLHRYGLPVIGSIISEPSFAKLYLLDHQRQAAMRGSRLREKREEEFEVHAWCLGRFVMDYLTQTCLGEARHRNNNCYSSLDCDKCNAAFKGIGSLDRESASSKLIDDFGSYREALDSLNHIFWDHAWSKGMGGWVWGNISWIAFQLYEAFEAKDLNKLVHWLDIVSGITHNGAVCLNSKYAFYNFYPGVFNRVLWAKFHGQPCCLQYLEGVITNTNVVPCQHAQSSGRIGKIANQPILRPGMEPMWQCKNWNCNKAKKAFLEFDPQMHYCRSFCVYCHTCNCRCKPTRKIEYFQSQGKCSCSYGYKQLWRPPMFNIHFEDGQVLPVRMCASCSSLERFWIPDGVKMRLKRIKPPGSWDEDN